MSSTRSSGKKSSKKDRKEKKRRLSTSTDEPENKTQTKVESPSKPLSPSAKSIKEEQPSKKVKFEDTKKTVKCLTFPSKYSTEIHVQVEDKDPAANPILVSFPSGLPLPLIASNSNSNSNTARVSDDGDDQNMTSSSAAPVFTWTKARKASSRGRILHGSDSNCTYIASNEGRGDDGRLTKSYVCIYHKPTNTVRMYPSAERGTVFALHQSVSSYQDSKSVDYSNLTMKERRRMVFESFGSNKKKKVLRSQDANVVEMKSVVGAGAGMMKALGKQWEGNALVSDSNKKIIEEIRKGGGTDRKTTAIEKAYAEARRAFLPPFDEEANQPYRVYDSQEVAGEEAWDQISRVVDACIHKEDWKDAMEGKFPWPKSTGTLLGSIANTNIKKGTKFKYQVKTICLVNHLVKFHNRASKKFMDGTQEELAKYLGLPKVVSNRFLELFCVPSYDRGRAGYATSKQLKDKRVVYTLIMYLLAHGKEMKAGSIEQLCIDMQIETKDAVNFYREAGCKCVKGKTGHTSVSLLVPLVFPPPKRGKKT